MDRVRDLDAISSASRRTTQHSSDVVEVIEEDESDVDIRAATFRRRARNRDSSSSSGDRRRRSRERPWRRPFGRRKTSRTRSSSSSEPPWKRRSRGHRRRKSRSTSTASDDDSIDKTYGFVIPRLVRTPPSLESTVVGSQIDESDHEDALRLTHGTGALQPEVTYNISRSEYTGGGVVGGEHTVELTTVTGYGQTKTALYQWTHFYDETMNFDAFHNAVVKIHSLTNAQRLAISKLLARVRKECDRPHPALSHTGARSMMPNIMSERVLAPSNTREKSPAHRMLVLWACLPYLVHNENSTRRPTLGKGSHPPRLVSQDNAPSNGYCVAQIWYLAVGERLLVTCGHRPISAFTESVISVHSMPSSDLSKTAPNKLLVHYGPALLWSFSLDECDTWFAMMTKFIEFWPQPFRLSKQGKVVTREEWPQLIQKAKAGNGHLRLRFQLEQNRTWLPPAGILLKRAELLSTKSTNTLNPVSTDDDNDKMLSAADVRGAKTTSRLAHSASQSNRFHDFSAFSWLSTTSEGPTQSLLNGRTQMYQDLKRIDRFLRRQTSLEDRLAYEACPLSSWKVIYSLLDKDGGEIAKSPSSRQPENRQSRREEHERKVRTFNQIQLVFEFYLPLLTEGPTIDKFWGATSKLLEIAGRTNNPSARYREPAEAKLYAVFEELQLLKDLLCGMPDQINIKVKIPNQLIKAWLHIVMSLIHAADLSISWQHHARSARMLVKRASRLILRDLSTQSLLKHSVVMPREIASLLNLRVMKDVSGNESHRDIIELYRQQYEDLRSEVTANPTDRSHQNKIASLRRQVALIAGTFASQRTICGSMSGDPHEIQAARRRVTRDRVRVRQVYDRPDHSRAEHMIRDASDDDDQLRRVAERVAQKTIVGPVAEAQTRLSALDPSGYREILVQECLDTARMGMFSFQEMERELDDLERERLQLLEWNRDRQDAAIYVFTIVTVIFLPLSTVATILGMNTNDVRNMDYNQWLFWAVAVPLTAVIGLICLAATGQLKRGWQKLVVWLFRGLVVRAEVEQSSYPEDTWHRHRPTEDRSEVMLDTSPIYARPGARLRQRPTL